MGEGRFTWFTVTVMRWSADVVKRETRMINEGCRRRYRHCELTRILLYIIIIRVYSTLGRNNTRKDAHARSSRDYDEAQTKLVEKKIILISTGLDPREFTA